MPRLASLLSVLVLALGAGACGDKNGNSGDASGGKGVNPGNTTPVGAQPTTLGSTVPAETTTSQADSPPASTQTTP
jgi:hypothetical protein